MHAVAGRADLAIDLVAALQLRLIERAEWSFEGEVMVFRFLETFARKGSTGRQGKSHHQTGGYLKGFRHKISHVT